MIALQLSPFGVVRSVYPPANSSLGIDLLARSTRNVSSGMLLSGHAGTASVCRSLMVYRHVVRVLCFITASAPSAPVRYACAQSQAHVRVRTHTHTHPKPYHTHTHTHT